MSEAQALKTLFPVPYELPLAGRLIRVGRLKLRQKAELQAWLDALPEPNERIKAALASSKKEIKTWPISFDDMPVLLDEEQSAKRKFLQVVLPPFNPGMSQEQINEMIDDCDSDAEIRDIMVVAMFGVDPNSIALKIAEQEEGEPAEKKSEASRPSSTLPT